MSDPQVTITPVPEPTMPSATSHDFFGGSEDVFQQGDVVPVSGVTTTDKFSPNQESAQEDTTISSSSTFEPIPEPTFVPEANIPEGPVFGVGPEEPVTSESPQIETSEPTFTPEPMPEFTSIPEPIWEAPVATVEEASKPEADFTPIEEVVEPVTNKSFEPEPTFTPEPMPELEATQESEPEEHVVEDETPELEEEPMTPKSTVAFDPELEPKATSAELSELGKKFMELFQMTKQIYDFQKIDNGFDLVGADNDKVSINYRFFLGNEEFPLVSITKTEKDKDTEEDDIHDLSFYLDEDGKELNVNLDDELLFEESVDLQEDMKKKMQVTEKLNKFIFLIREELKRVEKEAKLREAEEQENRKLQDIFRNF